MSYFKILKNGLINENPTFVLLLGMCPTLGTTSSAINGLSMGLATTFVLILSNFIISLIKNLVPDQVRIPSYIVVIASLVTILQMLMQAYLPSIYATLGRAEAFAAKNGPISSIFDGIGIGLGFSMALTLLGACREILGTGVVFKSDDFGIAGIPLQGESGGMLMFVLAPGAFIVLGYLIALVNKLRKA